VIKRISLLVTAALLVATMAMAGLASPALASPGEDACLAQNDADTRASWGKDPNGGGWTCTTTTIQDTSPSQGTENDNRAKPFRTTTTDSETTSGQGGGGGQQTNPKHQDPPPDDTTRNRGGNEVKKDR
jgi:hypothetical protein